MDLVDASSRGAPAPPASSKDFGVPKQAVGTAVGAGLDYNQNAELDVVGAAAKRAFWLGVAALVPTLLSILQSFVGLPLGIGRFIGSWLSLGSLLSPLLLLSLGITAWVVANRELAAIRSGQSSPAGIGMARAGRAMGIIVIALTALKVLFIIWIIALFTGAF